VISGSTFVGAGHDALDLLDAAPLTFAIVITYRAVKVSGTRYYDLVAIYGIGSLGHLAPQDAKIAGAGHDLVIPARGGRHYPSRGIGYGHRLTRIVLLGIAIGIRGFTT
jgi:D-arabinose 1-dehydrogenase-like Zn-dependent alcohol dehydrogenase